MAATEMGEVDEIHSNEETIKDAVSVNGDVCDYKEAADDENTNEMSESAAANTDEEPAPADEDPVGVDEDADEDTSVVEDSDHEQNLTDQEQDQDQEDNTSIHLQDLESSDDEPDKMEVEEIIHDDDSSDDQIHEIDSDMEDDLLNDDEDDDDDKVIDITNGLNSSDEVVIADSEKDAMNDSSDDVVLMEDENKEPIEVEDDDKDPMDVDGDDKDPIDCDNDPVENGSLGDSEDDLDISEDQPAKTLEDGKVGDAAVKKPKIIKDKSIDSGPPRRSSRNLNREKKSYVEEEEEMLEAKAAAQKKANAALEVEEVDHSSEESDIEEVLPQDPLANADPPPPPPPVRHVVKPVRKKSRMSSSTIVVKDTKCLAEIASKSAANNNNNNKKEPTLVIIDTNSILSGRGPIPIGQKSNMGHHHSHSHHSTISNSYSMLPMALPAQGIYPANMRATITPIPMTPPPPPPKPAPPPPPPPPVLPTLTDDMFVVEAPSFIVPYVYEKPPIKDLRDFIRKLENDISELKKKVAEELEVVEKEKLDKENKEKEERESQEKEEREIKEQEEKEEEEKLNKEKEEQVSKDKDKEKEKKTNKEAVEESVEDKEKTDQEKEKDEEDEEKTDQEKVDADKVKPEKMDVDQEDPDKEKTQEADKKEKEPTTGEKVEVKKEDTSTKTDLPSMPVPSVTTLAAELRKPPATYFDSPLGKFFMSIGYGLVQEAVQSDLLKQQKRRRDREGGQNPETMKTINSLIKNLEFTKENNEPYRMPPKKCEFCSFKTESSLAMAYHLETPHMKNYVYRCNFCPYEVRSPHDILFHMEVQHGVRGRLERAPAFHQCPNCPFEDNQKGKLSRHLVACARKFKPDRNLEPPADYEPPAKIPRAPRMKQQGLGTAAAVYQAMARTSQYQMMSKMSGNMPALQRGRGRPSLGTPAKASGVRASAAANMLYKQANMSGGSVLVPTNYQLSGNQLYQVVGGQEMGARLGPSGATAFLPSISAAPNSITIQQQQQSPLNKMKTVQQQPSISITPLPRGTTATGVTITKPGESNPKNSFVICEICDGYIKDLEQLRNHMQWIHKVKIHPKMIYNRPPLNCQKCQFRFFTDQGLERHLLGSHGLVTSSMQEAANRSKDAGRCPVCGRVYQWKLLNHVARDHNMTLKPAHLSYKCTVCTATFGMYKQFESHVYSAHSVVAKRVMDKKNAAAAAAKTESVLKPLKINDEITIIPQPAQKPTNGASSSKEDSIPSTSGTSITARNSVGYSNGNPGTSKSTKEPRNEPSPSTSSSRSERLARRKTTSSDN